MTNHMIVTQCLCWERGESFAKLYSFANFTYCLSLRTYWNSRITVVWRPPPHPPNFVFIYECVNIFLF